MPLLDLILLAIVQGLTEFLPVSSSGHLVVVNALLQSLGRPQVVEDLLEVNIVLHLGTLLAVVVVYWHELLRLLGEDRRVASCFLIVGTMPAAAIGVPLKLFGRPVPGEPAAGRADVPGHGPDPVVGESLPAGRRGGSLPGPELPLGAWHRRDAGLRAVAGHLAEWLDHRRRTGRRAESLQRRGVRVPAGLAGDRRRGAIEVAKLVKEAMQRRGRRRRHFAGFTWRSGRPFPFIVGWFALRQLLRFVRQGKLALFCWYLVPLGVAVTVWQLWLRSSGG